MPATKLTRPPAVETSPDQDRYITCYVRSTVPGPIGDTIGTIVDRLDRLCDHGRIDEYDVVLWPPARDAIAETIDRRDRTRTELLADFERWADRNGYSLEPAFRTEDVPTSPFGLEQCPPERVRVPMVALAVHAVDEADAIDETGPDTLCGVIPCSDPQHEGGRTYTVDEWLSAIERQQYDHATRTGSALTIDGQR